MRWRVPVDLLRGLPRLSGGEAKVAQEVVVEFREPPPGAPLRDQDEKAAQRPRTSGGPGRTGGKNMVHGNLRWQVFVQSRDDRATRHSDA